MALAVRERTGQPNPYMEIWVGFWNETEGRDKFTKCIQYATRGISYILEADSDVRGRLSSLSKTAADSRKIFRLGKSINEYLKISKLLESDSPNNLLILSRIGFFGYWLFDGLVILTKTGVIKKKPARFLKLAAYCWLIGLLTSILNEIRIYQKSIQDQRREESDLPKGGEGGPQIAKKYQSVRHTCCINLIKNLGDTITASHNAEIPHRVIGHGFNDGLVGIGGFTSAFLTCIQLIQAQKAKLDKKSS